MKALKPYDKHNLLSVEKDIPDSLDDIFADDEFDLLSDDADIFTLKNVPKQIAKQILLLEENLVLILRNMRKYLRSVNLN